MEDLLGDPELDNWKKMDRWSFIYTVKLSILKWEFMELTILVFTFYEQRYKDT